MTISAGLSIPLLVVLDTPRWSLAVAGLLAACGAALEGFLDFGHRWRQQRRTAVLVKAEGLKFIELKPPYDKFQTHDEAFPQFIDHLERINEAQSEDYLALVGRPPGDAAVAGQAAQERARASGDS